MKSLWQKSSRGRGWGKVKNGNGVSYALIDATSQAGLDVGADSSALHVGMRHVF